MFRLKAIFWKMMALFKTCNPARRRLMRICSRYQRYVFESAWEGEVVVIFNYDNLLFNIQLRGQQEKIKEVIEKMCEKVNDSKKKKDLWKVFTGFTPIARHAAVLFETVGISVSLSSTYCALSSFYSLRLGLREEITINLKPKVKKMSSLSLMYVYSLQWFSTLYLYRSDPYLVKPRSKKPPVQCSLLNSNFTVLRTPTSQRCWARDSDT